MIDLDITKACSEVMGLAVVAEACGSSVYIETAHRPCQDGYDLYDPLHDDAQCFALVKSLNIQIDSDSLGPERKWSASIWNNSAIQWMHVENVDLNRAICECVAKLK